ncbi:MAG: hypothetical protein ACPLPR_03900 [Bacillota bacterium]
MHAATFGFFSFATALAMTGPLNKAAASISVGFAGSLLLTVILAGIGFDMVGVAVASADEAVFHALASKKLRGAKKGVWLCRNRARVISFCNDFVGDVCGTIAGAIGTVLAMKVGGAKLVPVVVAGVASLNVAGKALAKGVAVSRPNDIVRFVGIVLDWVGDLGWGRKGDARKA